jgi:hypothetical protein
MIVILLLLHSYLIQAQTTVTGFCPRLEGYRLNRCQVSTQPGPSPEEPPGEAPSPPPPRDVTERITDKVAGSEDGPDCEAYECEPIPEELGGGCRNTGRCKRYKQVPVCLTTTRSCTKSSVEYEGRKIYYCCRKNECCSRTECTNNPPGTSRSSSERDCTPRNGC